MNFQDLPREEFQQESLILALELLRVMNRERKTVGVLLHALSHVQMSVVATLPPQGQAVALEGLESYMKAEREKAQAGVFTTTTQLH